MTSFQKTMKILFVTFVCCSTLVNTAWSQHVTEEKVEKIELTILYKVIVDSGEGVKDASTNVAITAKYKDEETGETKQFQVVGTSPGAEQENLKEACQEAQDGFWSKVKGLFSKNEESEENQTIEGETEGQVMDDGTGKGDRRTGMPQGPVIVILFPHGGAKTKLNYRGFNEFKQKFPKALNQSIRRTMAN